jgi:hypothetical protein
MYASAPRGSLGVTPLRRWILSRGAIRRHLAIAVLALAVVAVPSCGDAREELRAELETLPAPAHLVLIQESEEGPSACFAGDCPGASRYYASERTVDSTCADVRDAIERWGVADASWRLDPCSLSTTHGGDELGVAVFDVRRLPPSVADGIDSADRDRYRAAVLITLTRD